MKYNKIALWVSITVTAICLIAYSCFGYITCIKNCFIKDIALALLGSAALVIATSLIGYFVERSHLRQEIIRAVLDMNILENTYRINGSNLIHPKEGVKIIREVQNKSKICYYLLKKYQQGNMGRDKELNQILSIDFPEYIEKDLKYFEQFIRDVKIENNKIITDDKPGESEKLIMEKIFSWMKKRGFDFDENFESDIIEDEKEQEKND